MYSWKYFFDSSWHAILYVLNNYIVPTQLKFIKLIYNSTKNMNPNLKSSLIYRELLYTFVKQ